jgi:hypothetical protein
MLASTLCTMQNNVIREIFMVAVHSYGVKQQDVIGFRSGYKGLSVSLICLN